MTQSADYITELEKELKGLRKKHTEKHGMFAIKLCSFDKLDAANFREDGAIQFTGYSLVLLDRDDDSFVIRRVCIFPAKRIAKVWDRVETIR